MTLAEALNEDACSCGLEEGRTWFADSNGDEPLKVGEYTLLRNSNGVRVENEPGGFAVAALKEGSNTPVWARYTDDFTWVDSK